MSNDMVDSSLSILAINANTCRTAKMTWISILFFSILASNQDNQSEAHKCQVIDNFFWLLKENVMTRPITLDTFVFQIISID